jgi:hypothetical protein
MSLLQAVGLGDRAHHTPNQLSGGQQQRVAIARSLVNDPELILADEPTGNLDSRTSVEIMEILQRLNRDRGITVLLITHEHDIAEYATRVVTVRDGRILTDEPVPRRRDAAAELLALPPVEAEALGVGGDMGFRETFRVALRAIRRNKVRSRLTMLGRDHRRRLRHRDDRPRLRGPGDHRRADPEPGHHPHLPLLGQLGGARAWRGARVGAARPRSPSRTRRPSSARSRPSCAGRPTSADEPR